ncbi:MAG: ABC transporter permease [Chloroflexi bacterium]|nr:ABC transporter permease [Chloroflexota bacterium]
MIGLIAGREIRERVRSRGFWLTTVGTPLLLLALWGISSMLVGPIDRPLNELVEVEEFEWVVGYVDDAGLIESIPYPAPAESFREFATREAASAALAAGDIRAYYVIPPGYGRDPGVQRYSERIPAAAADTRWMNWILVKNLFPEGDFRQTAQLRWPFNSANPVWVSVGEQRTVNGEAATLLPLLVALAVVAPLISSGSNLMEGLSDEKRGRVLEILVSSTETSRLFWGKLLGIGAVTALQYVVWVGVALLLARPSSLIQGASEVELSAGEVGAVAVFVVGGYLLYAGLLAGVGALTPENQNNRAWVILLTLPLFLPVLLWSLIAGDPNGSVAVFLSLLPISSPAAMTMRIAATSPPTWQIGASAALLVGAGIGLVVFVARVFRASILLGGETLSARTWARTIRVDTSREER